MKKAHSRNENVPDKHLIMQLFLPMQRVPESLQL